MRYQEGLLSSENEVVTARETVVAHVATVWIRWVGSPRCGEEYAFRYNYRDDAQAMYETVGNRVRSVGHGRYGQIRRRGRLKLGRQPNSPRSGLKASIAVPA